MVPLPRFRGGGGKGQQFRFTPSKGRKKEKEAERRQTLFNNLRTSGCGRATESRLAPTRPLSGALACRRSTTALAKESISSPRRDPGHASWEAASTRRASLRRRRTHFQRCTPRAGHNAGRLMPEPPECAADEATPAGTALAPLRPASPGRRPFRARFDSSVCTRNGDHCQASSLYWGRRRFRVYINSGALSNV